MKSRGLHTLLARAAWLWLFILVFIPSPFSQTTNISGTVNVYQKIIQVIPVKACVRVSSTTGLNPSAKVLIVQMKGASIDVSNSSTFGDTTALNEAGNYEVSTICAIRGDSVFLVQSLLNTYSPAAGKVQLVQFGEYSSANVTGTLTASAWNNTSGTGGVIAIYVNNDLTLNQSIVADAKGFGGGGFVQSNTSCNNSTSGYVYNATFSTPQSGAYKGEGIVDVTTAQSGGRGAPANGGGGGNNHNNSGGGGANLNAGGMGGGNSSSSSCFAAFKGEPGKALSSWGGTKIFLGGGGGAGHNNNAVFTFGGANGGGIIFIHANTITGNGYSISANGDKAGKSQADGAGGGGGGGTIIMDVATYMDSVIVEANGGGGGDSFDGGNIGLCYGGGGGGGGGAIYFSGAVPAIKDSVNAGAAGIESGRDNVNCHAVNPAVAGTTGQVITNYDYRTSSTLAGYCSSILPTELVSFRAIVLQKKILLQWQPGDASMFLQYVVQRWNEYHQWVTIATVASNDTQTEYIITDNDPLPGDDLYRLLLVGKGGNISYSPVRRVFIESDKEKIAVYPNPASDHIIIEGNTKGMVQIGLMDISGKKVLQRSILLDNITDIPLPTLPSGIYILHINETVRKLLIR